MKMMGMIKQCIKHTQSESEFEIDTEAEEALNSDLENEQ